MTASHPHPPPQPPEWVPPTPTRWPTAPSPSPPADPPRSMPMIVERVDDVANLLLARRIIVVAGPLDGALSEQTVTRLLLLDREDATAPITLHLSCADGELLPALDLAAALDMVGAEVTAIATGTVGGAAVAAYAAAGRRLAHPHAMFVLTEPRVEVDGDAHHVAAEAEQQQRRFAELLGRLAGASGRARTEVAADLRAGRVLSARDAADYGLVDEVIDPGSGRQIARGRRDR